MTDPAKRLAEIEARANAATKGPWRVVEHDCECWVASDAPLGPLANENGALSRPNAAFCAHAREDVPWLLGEIRAVSDRLALCVADEPTGVYQEGRRAALAEAVAWLRARANAIDAEHADEYGGTLEAHDLRRAADDMEKWAKGGAT